MYRLFRVREKATEPPWYKQNSSPTDSGSLPHTLLKWNQLYVIHCICCMYTTCACMYTHTHTLYIESPLHTKLPVVNFQSWARACHQHQALWHCSPASVPRCWRSFCPTVSHLLSLLQSVTVLAHCQPLDASCWTVLLYFSRYYTVRFKICLLFVFYVLFK